MTEASWLTVRKGGQATHLPGVREAAKVFTMT